MSLRGEVTVNLKALAQVVRDLKPRAGSRAVKYEEREARLRQRHQQLRAALREQAMDVKDKIPIEPPWMFHAFNEAVPDDAVVVAELMTHKRPLALYLDRTWPGGYLQSFGGLGQGLPNALGMKLAMPDRLVVVAVGDGAFFYNPIVASFGLCQEYHLPILTVIFNNSGYASQQGSLEKWYPDGFAHRSGQHLGTSIGPRPEYAKIVEAFGGCGEAVDRPQDVVPAIKRGIEAVKEGKPAVVDVLLAR